MFSIGEIGLFIAAILPAIILLIYIYGKDKADKEPIGTIIYFLILGALGCLPASFAESLFQKAYVIVLNKDPNDTIYMFFYYFFGVALAEEGIKWIILHTKASRNKNFDSLFDGLIYSAVISLGFATLENVLYVMQFGWSTAITRMFMSVPGHFFFAVLMGYNYSWGRLYTLAGKLEQNFKKRGFIPANAPEYSGKKHLIMSFMIPLAVHGAYDFFLMIKLPIVSIAITLICYGTCFKKVRKLAKVDTKDSVAVTWLIQQKYPNLWSSYNSF